MSEKEPNGNSRKKGAVSVQPAAVPHLSRELLARIEELLTRLGHATPEKIACVVALTDYTTPNGHSTLAKADYPIAAAAGTAQVGAYINRVLNTPGKKRDRETVRDYWLGPLRDVGIAQPVTVRAQARLKADPALELTLRGHWEVAKSSTNSYALTDEARSLLLETSDADWPAALERFVKGSRRRRERAAQVAASDTVAAAPHESKHSALIKASTTALLESELFDGFELVYTDDGDGIRNTDLEGLNLVLGLEDRYPDVILARVATRELWIIEAVTSDGEVDEAKLREVRAWAEKNGWTLAGATTAYATYKSYAARQQKMQNLASGSSVWIAENGGQLVPPLVSLAPKPDA